MPPPGFDYTIYIFIHIGFINTCTIVDGWSIQIGQDVLGLKVLVSRKPMQPRPFFELKKTKRKFGCNAGILRMAS
jgi:hypothetical protein